MQYIQLDNFNGNLNIICKDDGSGDILIFDTLKEAEDTLEENCQDSVIIPLDTNIINLCKLMSDYMSMATDEGIEDPELTKDLDEILQLKS
jgi:hypothetical protein